MLAKPLFLMALAVPLLAQSDPCPKDGRFGDPSASPSWNGWGADASNTRFQPARSAQLPAANLSQLKLRWAFGFPGVHSVFGQPVVAGRVFSVSTLVSSTSSTPRRLRLLVVSGGRGCAHRHHHRAVSDARPVIAAYFGDLKANVYALNAATGAQIWKVSADPIPARITGAPQLYENRLYVPVASGEEGAGRRPELRMLHVSRQRRGAGRGTGNRSGRPT